MKSLILPSVLFLSVEWVLVNGKFNGRGLQQMSCHEPGFFADVENCRKFYRCAEHETNVVGMPLLAKFEFQCPVGTAFDESLSICNYPHNVENLPPCPKDEPADPSSTDGSEDESNSQPDNNSMSPINKYQMENQPNQFGSTGNRVFRPPQQPSFPIFLPTLRFSNVLYYKK